MNFFLWMGFPYHIHGDPGGVVGAAELAGESDDKAFVAGAHKLRKFLRRGTGRGGGRLGGLHVRDQRGDIHAAVVDVRFAAGNVDFQRRFDQAQTLLQLRRGVAAAICDQLNAHDKPPGGNLFCRRRTGRRHGGRGIPSSDGRFPPGGGR